MKFDAIIKLYTDYISKDFNEKLHAGELLAESAGLLLKMENQKLDNESALQREFLLRKVAGDLLRQAENMGMTKQYDCAPVLKKYTYLAFDLAYDYCEFKPNRRLLPFLAHVIYYENFNESKEYLNRLKDIYNRSLILEKKYIDTLIVSNSPVYKVDTGEF